jgi:hypothetical protein
MIMFIGKDVAELSQEKREACNVDCFYAVFP